jgi:antitoxin ParD1/3/4
MPTMNISLPEQLKEHVEAQVSSGQYTSASEYMRELVRLDIQTRERERIEQAVLAGIHSGPAIEMTPAVWEELRKELFPARQPLRERG